MIFLRFLCSIFFLKSLFKASLFIILFVGLCFGTLNLYTQHGKYIQVPDIKTLDLKLVASILEQNDLRFQVLDSAKFNPAYPPFSVIEQYPTSGSGVKKGRKIYLTVNPSGYRKLSVPNIIQITRRNAETRLTAVGFQLGKISYRKNIGKDMVLEIRYKGNRIEPGIVLPKTSKIDLVLGNGKR